MMINKRLIGLVPESRRFVAQNVAFQWVSLVANICLISVVCRMLGSIFEHSASTGDFVLTAGAALAAIAVRALCTTSAAKASFRAAQSVKQRLRPIIYEKRPAKTGRAPRPWLGRTRSPATGCNHYKVRNSYERPSPQMHILTNKLVNLVRILLLIESIIGRTRWVPSLSTCIGLRSTAWQTPRLT